jgi:succinyl-diaminopimelate desuccinylase
MTALGDKALQLAQSLIHCESVTPADDGALDVLIQALKPARFTFWRLSFKDEGTPPVDNLYARVGEGPPHLCFAGHVDVVPPGDAALWTHPPFAADVADGTLYGRGASDMKGAIACFVAAALDYVRWCGREIDGSISLLITGDEEGPAINGTRKVLAWMKEQGERPDHCLVGEPTNAKRIGEAIKIGRRGSLNGRLTVKGTQGHVAYPHLAGNPVKGLVKVLARLYDSPLDYGSAHFSPSNLEVTTIDVGNPTTNIIPASAEARFNVRFNDRHEADALKEMLREQARLALSGSGLSFSIEFEPHAESFLTEPGPFDALLSEAVREVTGLTPSLSTDGGTSDARFIKAYCPVIELGLTTATIHKVDERVTLADLEQLTAVYRRFIALYFETFGGTDAG